MKTSSAKQKGRRLAQRIAALLKNTFNLNEDDIFCNPGGVPGEDIKLSEKARVKIPFSIEAKNVEKLNIWAALEQAESENRKYKPLLVFSRNRSVDYCALKFEDLVSMLLQIKNLKDELQIFYEEKSGLEL
jgi:hypothetical protein